MKPMPEKMKEELRRQKQIKLIYDKIHTKKETKPSGERERKTYILPEGFTGKDWEKALRLIRKRKTKEK